MNKYNMLLPYFQLAFINYLVLNSELGNVAIALFSSEDLIVIAISSRV